LGAIWRESKHDIRKKSREPYEMLRGNKCVYFGWPSGGEGFWLLWINKFEVSNRRIPVSLIYDAISIDEKCEMIKLLRETFISDPKKFPILDLADDA
jgi:hypothetical protein